MRKQQVNLFFSILVIKDKRDTAPENVRGKPRTYGRQKCTREGGVHAQIQWTPFKCTGSAVV